MKRFGEYLVEKGAVTRDQLVDALIEQLKSQPLPCEVVRSQKLMASEALLAVFNVQADRGIGFVQAARELGSWSPEWDEVIENASLGRRLPLGELLVKRGAIDLPQMTLLLDDYLSEEGAASSLGVVVQAVQAKSANPSATPSAAVQAFLEATNESVRQEFENIFSFMEMWDDFKGQSQQLVLADLVASLQKIHSAADAAGAAGSAQLVGGLEVTIRNLMETAASLGPDVPPKVGRVGSRAIAQLWDLRESLRTEGVEARGSGVEEILQASEGLNSAGGSA